MLIYVQAIHINVRQSFWFINSNLCGLDAVVVSFRLFIILIDDCPIEFTIVDKYILFEWCTKMKKTIQRHNSISTFSHFNLPQIQS